MKPVKLFVFTGFSRSWDLWPHPDISKFICNLTLPHRRTDFKKEQVMKAWLMGEWGWGKQRPEICIQNCIMTWIRVLSFCFSFREDSVNLTKDLNFFFQSLGSKFSKDCKSVPCLQQDWQRRQQRAVAEQQQSFHYPWDQCLTRHLLEWWREGHCWDYLTKWNCWMEWWTTGHWGCPGLTAVKTEQGKFGSLNFYLVYSPPKEKYLSSSYKKPALEPFHPHCNTELWPPFTRACPEAPHCSCSWTLWSCTGVLQLSSCFHFSWGIPIPVLI